MLIERDGEERREERRGGEGRKESNYERRREKYICTWCCVEL